MNSPKFSVFMLALLLSLPIAVQATDAGTLKLQAISRPGKGEARVPEVSWRKSGTYIIEFHSPPLAQYSGGIRNLPPTSPAATGDARLDANSTAARSYLSHLSAEQSRGLLAIQRATGNFRQPEARLTHAFNGVVMKLSAEEAERISRLPEVKRLVLDEIRQLHTTPALPSSAPRKSGRAAPATARATRAKAWSSASSTPASTSTIPRSPPRATTVTRM